MTPIALKRAAELASQPGMPSERKLDLWLISANLTEQERQWGWSMLAPAEQERAGRFRFEADRNRFVAARSALRSILAARTGATPQSLMLRAGEHGKPALEDAAWEFNVSHSGACVLIGVCREVACGVDIEVSDKRRSEEDIAERFFSAREVEWMRKHPRGFFRLWTAKEAVIKAVGRGLSVPLPDVDVTDVVAGRNSSIFLETPDVVPRKIFVRELALVEGYAAAVATDGAEAALRIVTDE
jgi:4'-phosphopantetheinyl transferase